MNVSTIDTAAQSAVFYPVSPIETRLGVPQEDFEERIRANMEADHPRFHHRSDYGKWKGRPLALVSGGPSLRKTLHEIRDFSDVMVCGSPHDFLIGEGIVPTYSVQCDYTRSADYVNKRPDGIQYLLASCCQSELFSGNVSMWHMEGGVDPSIFQGEPRIQGGCTVTLRAINLAILLGYHDLHFFGFDSCFDNAEDQHAYTCKVDDGLAVPVRVGDRVFLTSLTFLAQAQQFQKMANHLFNPIIHGDGLIAEIVRLSQGENHE